MKKILSLGLLSLFLISCSSDDNKKDESSKVTQATVVVKNSNGTPAKGIKVYSYHHDIWEGFGDDSFFANANVITDAEGKANFSDIDYDGTFMNSNQETFHFSAHYTRDETDYKVASGETFSKGEAKIINITLR